MKLTYRQRDFLGHMEVLQTENQGGPVHYSVLADRLDVGNSTAYHMLRVLEDKGCIESQYYLPKVRSGRSSVLFALSEEGRDFLAASSSTNRTRSNS